MLHKSQLKTTLPVSPDPLTIPDPAAKPTSTGGSESQPVLSREERRALRQLKHEEHVLQHHMASLCGSLAMTMVGYPFDTVKTILQLNGSRANPGTASSASPSKPVFRKAVAAAHPTASDPRRTLSTSISAAAVPPSSSSSARRLNVSLPTTTAVVASQIYKQHGLLNGFYRGVSMPLVSVMGMHFIGYPTYLKLKHVLGDSSMTAVALSGMASGFIVSVSKSAVDQNKQL